jgi:hypothetical protein
MGYLNIPDLPSAITITNISGVFLRLSASGSPGLPDLAIGATVTIPLVNMWESRRLRRFNSIIDAYNASLITIADYNSAWGTLQVTNLTGSTQQLGNLIPFAGSEVRQVSLINTTVSRRIRIWRWLNNVNAGSTFAFAAGSETPDVLAISPVSGDTGAGQAVTITGTNFVTGATVTIGGVACTSVVVVSATEITAVAPTHAVGVVDVVVTNSSGHTGTLVAGYTYGVNSFVSIAPTTDDLAGGAVTITGTGFVTGATVTIGGNACTSVVVVSATEITAVAPIGTAGAKNVVITNPGSGGSVATGTGAFTYTANSFVSMTPTGGSHLTTTPVTITGTHFVAGSTVAFGANPATAVVVVSATSITCTAPTASGAGAVNVIITSPGSGGSVATGTAAFTYT